MAEQGAINIKNPKLADQLAVGDGGLFGKSDKSSASAYAGDWGNHTTTIDFGSTALSPKQVLIWGGVLFLGWFFWRKIKGLKK